MSDQHRYTEEEAALNTARHEVSMAEYRLTGEVTEAEAFADRIDATYRANVRAQVLREAASWFDRYDTDSAAQLRRMAEEGEAR